MADFDIVLGKLCLGAQSDGNLKCVLNTLQRTALARITGITATHTLAPTLQQSAHSPVLCLLSYSTTGRSTQ